MRAFLLLLCLLTGLALAQSYTFDGLYLGQDVTTIPWLPRQYKENIDRKATGPTGLAYPGKPFIEMTAGKLTKIVGQQVRVGSTFLRVGDAESRVSQVMGSPLSHIDHTDGKGRALFYDGIYFNITEGKVSDIAASTEYLRKRSR